MHCSNCGCENNDNNMYCVKCGAKLSQSSNNDSIPSAEKDKKMPVLISVCACLVVITLIACVLICHTVLDSDAETVAADDTDIQITTAAETTASTSSVTQETTSVTEATIKKTTAKKSTTKESTTKKTTATKVSKAFYKGKYYYFADERGELNIAVFQLTDNNVKYTVYDTTQSYSSPAYSKSFPLEWNSKHTRAENDYGMVFIIDYDSKTVKYKDADMDDFEKLKEYDALNKSNLKKFASQYQ